MPVFHYQAIDSKGKKTKGFVDAMNELEAKQKLREQGVMLTKLGSNQSLKRRQHLNADQLLAFSTMMNQLMSAKLPLYESLTTLEEQVRAEPYHRIILSLAEQVKAGSTLSDAMKHFPDSFNSLYVSMIAAGEASGSLESILDRLVLFLNKQSKLRKQISNALIYPGILAAFAFCVIILLMGFVVPSMEGIFEGRTLNGFTEVVLGISRFLRSHWLLLIILIGGSGFGLFTYLRRPKGQQDLERLLMKMPLIKTLLIEAALVRFSRTLSTLLEGGLPLIDGLKLSAGVMQNHLMQEEVKRAENRVLEGGRLKDEFRRSRYLPQMAIRMMAIGEDSGHLSDMLKKVADIYEEDLEKTIERTMSLAQPCILIIMGAIIGLVLLAILLPMTDLSSLTET